MTSQSSIFPSFGERINDQERKPKWIPGTFPTIFQNGTGDPFNVKERNVDLKTWGPHLLRFRGWWAQTHMTFMYWWMNLIQRTKVLEAKQWYVRDNPEAQGFTAEKMRELGVKGLAENMVGYTKNIPGTKASKKRLRRLILTMVQQIEIETRDERVAASGDIPCLFGTLTTERYHWDEIMRIIAQVEGVVDGQQASWIKGLSKSKRHELVNKYPLFVAWYCAMKLELQLKTVVIPCFEGHAYVAVFEWSPTGGMVHLHYILEGQSTALRSPGSGALG